MGMGTATIRRAAIACLFVCALSGCGSDGPPDNGDVDRALRKAFAHQNDRGGIRINMGSAGGLKDIRFDVRLHSTVVHACTGKDRVYVCDITYRASFPPVKEEPERIRTQATFFDGPGGWRLIE
jgi:hypothetical protein